MPLSKKARIMGLILVLVVASAAAYTLTPDTNPTKQKVKAGVPSILGVVPYIGEHFKDTDGDGIVDAKDPHPTIHDFPATAYANGKGLPQDVIDKLAPLNNGSDGVPQLDTNEKAFIDYLSRLDPTQQIELVKLAQDGEIRGDLALIDYINYLNDPELAKILVFGFSTNSPTPGEISPDDVEQLQFLKRFPLEKQKELIRNGLFCNIDWDNDGMSNRRESDIGYPYDVRNDIYYILGTSGYGGGNGALQNIHKYITGGQVLDQNIINLKGDWGYPLPQDPVRPKVVYTYKDDLTYSIFKEGVEQVIANSDKEDIVYVLLHGDGNTAVIRFADGTVRYDEINELLNEINAKAIVVTIDACHSGAAINHLKGDKSPMVVMTQCRADQFAGNARLAEYFFEGLTNLGADRNGNGYVSVEEGFNYAKERIGSFPMTGNGGQPCEAQIGDVGSISSEIYLGVYPVKPQYNN